MTDSTIIYTHTDEAPLLATYSFLPIIEAYAAKAGVGVETRDISLAGRIIAAFSDRLPEDQQVPDALGELGELAKSSPGANIIKLPNISASVPQLKAAIAELQEQGYELPEYDEAKDVYDTVKGSAVNPVLREGNSDRRAPESVKNYARKHPHSMGAWSSESRTNVASMDEHDFRHNEKSVVVDDEGTLRIELVTDEGTEVLKEFPVEAGEVVDATFMSTSHLQEFLKAQVQRAKDDGVLFSLHLKATMMKVSDPIIFGHAVRAFFPFVFAEHADALQKVGVNANDGMGALESAIEDLDESARQSIEDAIGSAYANGPGLAMVDSDRGITNLHVPSDVIVDASMPAMIRTSGHMWGPDGEEADTLAVIPDS
ncbi:MAG: NADP-dependent isocitrate dehydrogenase, partial [Marmoricola sp.]|nr:NADP-dependent isocitrate dehydrogenase [Marmoricola sp.]